MFECRSPHRSRRAVEVEEETSRKSGVLLTAGVVVERYLLHAGQDALLRVGVHPARLDETHLRVIGEIRHSLEEEVGVRVKVGVENLLILTSSIMLCN